MHVVGVPEHSPHCPSQSLHSPFCIAVPDGQDGMHSCLCNKKPPIQDVQVDALVSHVAQLDVHLSHVLCSSLEMVPVGHFSTHSCLSLSKYVFSLHDVHLVGSSLHPPHASEHPLHSRLYPYVPCGHSSTHFVPLKKYPLSHDLHDDIEPVHSKQGDTHFLHSFPSFMYPVGHPDVHCPLCKVFPSLHDVHVDCDVAHVAQSDEHFSHTPLSAIVPDGQSFSKTHCSSFKK